MLAWDMWRWIVRRHEVDVLSLVFGLFFLGAAAIWGISGDAVRALRGWPLPALLIAVGLVGLVTAVTTHRR
jgi:uncharacterized membrane protein YbhN (UPF0104 family)